MIYQCILFSFCLMGVASITTNVCESKDKKVEVTCTSDKQAVSECIFRDKDGKVVASTPSTEKQDNDYKEKASAAINKHTCKLSLINKDMIDSVKSQVNCSLKLKDTNLSESVTIAKGLEECSACNILKYTGFTLLLALLAPLLSEVL